MSATEKSVLIHMSNMCILPKARNLIFLFPVFMRASISTLIASIYLVELPVILILHK